MNTLEKTDQVLVNDIRFLIEEAKNRIAVAVNSSMTILYWQIGKLAKESKKR
jgi:hypothetical protein